MNLKTKIAYSLLLVGLTSTAMASPWPKATPDNANVVINGGPINIKVLANDVGTGLTLTDVNQYSEQGGTASISSDKLSINYTPANNVPLHAADAFAEDAFWYVFTDSEGRTNSTKVTVKRLTTWWPQSAADTAEVINYNTDTATAIPVLENDAGVDLFISSSNGYSEKGGIVTISADKQKILYKPAADFTGTDTLWYLMKDAVGRVNSAKVTITVSAGSTGWPQANPDSAAVSDGLAVLIPVLSNDTGQGLTLTETNNWTQNGGRSKIIGDSIEYTPPAGFTGTDAFWYVFADAAGRTNSAKVSIEVSNGQPNSVVAFCEATYETDGTPENTQLTSLLPEQAPELPDPLTVTDGVAVIGDRTYTLSDDSVSLQKLTMERDGETVVIATAADATKSIYYVGGHDGKVYFVVDQEVLYSHDGDELTTVGDSLAALASPGQHESITGVEFVPSVTDNFYFKILTTISFYSGGNAGYVFRVSDSGTPVFVGKDYYFSDPSGSTTTAVSEFYYFNGLDYYQYKYQRSDRHQFGSSRREETAQMQNGERLNTLDVYPDSIIADRGRLFVITEVATPLYAGMGVLVRPAAPSKLYVINNENNQFVELAVCE